jgi:enoyl-CoA hydratase/carnithine racemase
MADEVVLYRVEDGVAVITLNRPERMNAWTGQLQLEYFDHLAEANGSPDVGAIVLTGAGRGFCPGADMAGLEAAAGRQGESGRSGGGGGGGGGGGQADPRPMIFPTTIGKPLIAAINGACAGLGLVQALMCDLRFAVPGAKFTMAFSRRGLIAEHGASWLLPRLIGTSRALDVMLSSRVFTSEEALELGIVNRVVPADELMSEAIAYAGDLARNCSPASMAIIKQQVYRHAAMDLDSAWHESNKLMAMTLSGPDFKEGVTSFVEKRPPAFAPLGSGTPTDFDLD